MNPFSEKFDDPLLYLNLRDTVLEKSPSELDKLVSEVELTKVKLIVLFLGWIW